MMKYTYIFIFTFFTINIYSQNVGIGTTTPTKKLEVIGTTKTDTLQSKNLKITDSASANYILKTDDYGNASWVNGATLGLGNDNLGNLTASQNIKLGSKYLSPDGSNTGLSIEVGGTTTIRGNADNILNIGVAYANAKSIIAFESNAAKWEMGQGNGMGPIFTIRDVNGDEDPFIINTGSSSDRVVIKGQNVGIANFDPQETLDINGKTKTTNLQITSGAQSGYILQSDANGNATWAELNSGSETDPKVGSLTNSFMPKWDDTSLTNSLIYDDGSFIGIGTATPEEVLDIKTSNNAKVRATSTDLEAGFTAYAPNANGAFTEYGTYEGGNNKSRWSMGKSDEPETGNNTGGNYFINRYDDNGDYLGRVLNINRSTGYIGIGDIFDPSVQLQVLGTTQTDNMNVNDAIQTNSIKTSNFKLETNAELNKVMICDVDGNGTWSDELKVDLQKENVGTSWEVNANQAAVSGLGGNKSYQAGVYGYIKGSAANTGAVVGAYDANTWGALAYRDANIDDWGIYSNGAAKVNGKLTINDFKMTNGAADNYILKSDASGNASWISPSTLSITESDPQVSSSTFNKVPKWNGSTLTDGLIYDNGSNIGIGTTSPNYKLDIHASSGNAVANIQSLTNNAYLSSTSPAGQESTVKFNSYASSSSSPTRWNIGKGVGTENGNNTGSDFFINRYNDTGLYNGQPIAISRANGTVTIGNDAASATENTFKINGSMAVKVNRINSNNSTVNLSGADHMLVFAPGTSGNTVTLPAAASYTGRSYVITNRSASSVGISAYINASGVSTTAIGAYETINVVSDGVDWIKVN
jgi:hypothetical protein